MTLTTSSFVVQDSNSSKAGERCRENSSPGAHLPHDDAAVRMADAEQLPVSADVVAEDVASAEPAISERSLKCSSKSFQDHPRKIYEHVNGCSAPESQRCLDVQDPGCQAGAAVGSSGTSGRSAEQPPAGGGVGPPPVANSNGTCGKDTCNGSIHGTHPGDATALMATEEGTPGSGSGKPTERCNGSQSPLDLPRDITRSNGVKACSRSRSRSRSHSRGGSPSRSSASPSPGPGPGSSDPSPGNESTRPGRSHHKSHKSSRRKSSKSAKSKTKSKSEVRSRSRSRSTSPRPESDLEPDAKHGSGKRCHQSSKSRHEKGATDRDVDRRGAQDNGELDASRHGGKSDRERSRDREHDRSGRRDRSRSRSRSRSRGRERERERGGDRERGRRDREREGEQKERDPHVHSPGTVLAAPPTAGQAAAAAAAMVIAAAAAAAGVKPAAAPRVGAGHSSHANADASSGGAGVPASSLPRPTAQAPAVAAARSNAAAATGAAAAHSSRLLVSFSDELDEQGGLGGGAGSGGVRKIGGAVTARAAAAAPGLAASTAQRFMREEAAQRLSIPPRTITTAAAAAMPLQLRSMASGSTAPLTHAPPPPPSSLSPHQPFGGGGGGGGLPSPSFGAAAGGGLRSSSPTPPFGAAAATAAGNGVGSHYYGAGGGGSAGAGAAGAVEAGSGGAGGRSPSPGGPRSLGRVLFGMASARCARPYMEDRHCIIQCLRPLSASGQPLQDGVQRSLAAIYDGHNGVRAADTASARLHSMIAGEAALRSHTGELAPPAAMAAEEAAIGTALRRCFRRVDDEILAEARADGARDGATALVVLRLSDTLYAAHAGDSRAVLSRRGTAVRLTEDHKPNLPVERARVEAAGGRVDFQRCWRVIVEPRDGRLGSGLAVSRSLGDLDFKEPGRFVECEPDVRRLVPEPGDNLVVLASDGLWDVMSDQEAVECANAALQARHSRSATAPACVPFRDEDARVAAEALLEAAVRRGTADNVTVIVMLLTWD